MTDSFVEEPAHERPHVLADLRDGFSFVVRTPWLLWTLLFASIFVLVVIGPIEVLLPFIAADRFEDGARMYGLVLAAYGVGGALGALGGVVAPAAAALPDGDDADVGAGLAAAGGGRLDAARSR